MGSEKVVVPLLLVAVAFALPFLGGFVDDGLILGSEETGSDDAGSSSQTPTEASPESDGPSDEAASGSPDAGELHVGNLLTAADPTSPEGELIRERLDPLVEATDTPAEPLETPPAPTLYQATLAHPASTTEDLLYVESLAPLPPELDRALAQVVAAHAAATAELSQPDSPPGTSLRAAVTMATALDQAMPTLESYVDHPVWDRQPTDETDGPSSSSSTSIEAPSLPRALLNLYEALGFGSETIDRLEPQVHQAAEELGPEESQALAELVTAQVRVQHAAANSLVSLTAPSSHSDPATEATRDVDQATTGTPLEALQQATQQFREAAEATGQVFHGSPGSEHTEVFSGPLGLVVVGTPGDDVFGANVGGPVDVREPVGTQADEARSTVGGQETNATDPVRESSVPFTLEGSSDAQVTADAANDDTMPEPGWHMLVVDPGGNDTYLNNAGGIDAGSILVQVTADADTGSHKELILRDGEVCLPGTPLCDPNTGISQTIQAQEANADVNQGPVPIGVPLTAAVVDAGGDDDYADTAPVIQGSARGLGVGLLLDQGGDDTYEATEIAQGASERYGVGLLLDADGNDTYHARDRAQGWANVPNPNATFSSGDALTIQEQTADLLRNAEGTLIDTGGNDTYELAEDVGGQGISQLPWGFLRKGFFFFDFLGTNEDEKASAKLLDVGGEDQLPVPEVQVDQSTVEMRPSRVNVSDGNVSHFWLTRLVGDRAFDFNSETTERWKTAAQVSPQAIPDPVGEEAIRAGSVEFDCYESTDGTFDITQGVCFGETSTPELLFFGEPDRIDDPPALTLTFGGDTHYNGSIASTSLGPGLDLGSFFDFGNFFNPNSDDDTTESFVRALTPRVLVDLEGNDTYTGENETIAAVQDAGTAMVVDREGHDQMRAGNRSIAYADVSLSSCSGCGGHASVIDLDGDLTAVSGEESQSFAARDHNFSNPSDSAPTTLLDGGAGSESEDLELDLHAGNSSQAYSQGRGVAILVGSANDDTYHVDGWGQGVHDGQQAFARTCGTYHTEASVGGIGLFLDPDGDDTYSVDSGVGLGDAATEVPPECPRDPFVNGLRTRVNVLGIGSLLDLRGRDDYRVTDDPPRPTQFPVRDCSGPTRDECEPRDDRTWIGVDEEPLLGMADAQSAGTIGFGADNVRNAHHSAAAACRNFEVVRTSGSLTCEQLVQDTLNGMIGATSNSPVDRRPELEVSLPRPSTSAATTGAQAASSGEQLVPEELGLPDSLGSPEDPEALFLEDAARSQCEDRKKADALVARGPGDQGCLSVTQDVELGQWITNHPASEDLDPGDTVACNCSVRLQIRPQLNDSVFVTSNTDDEDEDQLYPSQGTFTTFTEGTETWYDAFNRFRAPLTTDELFEEGHARGNVTRAEAAADFPINLSDLPSGMSRVKVTATVEDVASEETGGLVDAYVRSWSLPLIQERDYGEALLATQGGQLTLFMIAPGPVDPDSQPVLEVAETDSDTEAQLVGNGWRHTDGDNFTRPLHEEQPIDGPTVEEDRIVPQRGPPACAALVLERHSDGEGACWTGNQLVVGFPLGGLDPATVEQIRVGGQSLEVANVSLDDRGEEPSLLYASQEEHSIDLSPVLGDRTAQGLPDRVLEEGEAMTERLAGEEPVGEWAKITVQPDPAGGVAAKALSPGTTSETTHKHDDVHHALGTGPDRHPHVKVLQSPEDRDNDPVVLDGKLLGGEASEATVGCVNLNYADLKESRRLVAEEIDERKERLDEDDDDDLPLRDSTCLTFSEGGELVYLVPLGDRSSTHIVHLRTKMMANAGDLHEQNFTAHIDPKPVEGNLSIQPAASLDTVTTVDLDVAAQTADDARLTSDDNDLTEIGLQARSPNGTWTDLGDPWGQLPTSRDTIVSAQVDVEDFVPQNATETPVELRGVIQDESNNTRFTNVRTFLVDRTAPQVSEARVVPGDLLVLSVDEPIADVDCLTEECSLDIHEPIPGADPQPFLAISELRTDARTITIPIVDLTRGPTYNVSLQLTDTVGNTALRNMTVDTFSRLDVDASPMANTLVNKTVTLNWTTSAVGNETVSSFTSAYLMLPEGPCAVLKGQPAVVSPGEEVSREEGPVSVQGEVGETVCRVPDEGTEATLLLYSLAPNIGGLAVDRVPVHVDTTSPDVNLTGPAGWVNETASVQATSNDSLPTELELYVEGELQETRREPAKATLAAEGVHEVVARATDEAGNVGVNRTEALIDRTRPSLEAEVVGVRGGLALVNATASDALSGVRDVQLRTSTSEGPLVPGVGNESVLLSAPVEADDEAIVLRTHDEAMNVRDVRLSLDRVPRIESGELVEGFRLSHPETDALDVSFRTANATSPIVIVDAGPRHVERVLDRGRDHDATIQPLPPGSEATVTIALPDGADLVPAANGTTQLPEDRQPPGELTEVTAEAVEGGVRLSWAEPSDDVGVREVRIERDGKKVARTSALSYVDEPGTFQEHTYKLAAVDQAGNRGPWTRLQAQPDAGFTITDLTAQPDVLTPEDPVTVTATVQTPAGLQTDLVTLSVGDTELPMERVSSRPTSATYEVHTRLPVLNVTAPNTDLVVTAQADGRTETERFPAPPVSTEGEVASHDPTSEVPGVGMLLGLSVLSAAALVHRRWSL